MNTNGAWLAFLFLIAAIVLWFGGDAVYKLYRYAQLSAKTSPTHIDWTVVPRGGDTYVLQASYLFQVNGESWQGTTKFLDYPFWNEWAAQQSIAEVSRKKWQVWYASTSPGQSTLEKKYPWKEVISAAILFTILAYFIWLGFYVKKRANVYRH